MYHHGPLLGAATVINNPSAEVFLKDGSLNAGPDDSAFLQSLRRSLKTSRGAYPPVALPRIQATPDQDQEIALDGG